MCVLSHVRPFSPPWTVALQAPLSMGFSRQEYWSELPFPTPGNLPNTGIELMSSALAGEFFTTEHINYTYYYIYTHTHTHIYISMYVCSYPLSCV